jgi:hypothetical protein
MDGRAKRQTLIGFLLLERLHPNPIIPAYASGQKQAAARVVL